MFYRREGQDPPLQNKSIGVYQTIALARQRPWLPPGGKLSQKTPKVDFVTDEGNWFVFVAFPLIRLAFARHLPPQGEGMGCVAKLNDKLQFEQL